MRLQPNAACQMRLTARLLESGCGSPIPRVLQCVASRGVAFQVRRSPADLRVRDLGATPRAAHPATPAVASGRSDARQRPNRLRVTAGRGAMSVGSWSTHTQHQARALCQTLAVVDDAPTVQRLPFFGGQHDGLCFDDRYASTSSVFTRKRRCTQVCSVIFTQTQRSAVNIRRWRLARGAT